MAEYKLYYFNLRGRAEIIRLVFAAAGQKYEDIRFPRDKWPEYKPKAPFGQCPYMEITEGGNTFTMAQSIAIARYLAKKFGFAGKNDNEAGLIDMYTDQLSDLVNEFAKMRHEKDETKKKELEEKLDKEVFPTHMKFIEERLAKSGSGFIASSGLSFADLYLYVILEWNPKLDELLSHFKLIKENREKVANFPGISDWLKVRPVTEI